MPFTYNIGCDKARHPNRCKTVPNGSMKGPQTAVITKEQPLALVQTQLKSSCSFTATFCPIAIA
jgi:hypothetical protein